MPITVALEHVAPQAHTWIFFSACVAIIPIARLIVLATEQISTRTGEAVGGLLNATFGNAPELIITLVALKAGYADMVRGSLIGAILANLLLALGLGFLFGGLRHVDQKFNSIAARAYSTMMLLAVTSLIVPSSFSRFFAPEGTIRQEQLLNIGIAFVLLAVYILYLVFSLKTHPHSFASLDQEGDSSRRPRVEPVASHRRTSGGGHTGGVDERNSCRGSGRHWQGLGYVTELRRDCLSGHRRRRGGE